MVCCLKISNPSNPTNTCLKYLNIFILLYHILALNIHEHLKYYKHQYYHNQLKNRTHIHIFQFFFILSTAKFCEVVLKHNEYEFILDSFALNRQIFTPLTKKKVLLPLKFPFLF